MGDCVCDSSYFAAGDGSCDRTCAAGFEGSGGDEGEDVCVGCQQSFYKTTSGPHNCEACPANSHSTVQSQTSIDSCVCDQGYVWNGTGCDQCEAGTFNNRANQTACFACVSNAPPSDPFAFWPAYWMNARNDANGWGAYGGYKMHCSNSQANNYHYFEGTPYTEVLDVARQACIDSAIRCDFVQIDWCPPSGYQHGWCPTRYWFCQATTNHNYGYWQKDDDRTVHVNPATSGYTLMKMCTTRAGPHFKAGGVNDMTELVGNVAPYVSSITELTRNRRATDVDVCDIAPGGQYHNVVPPSPPDHTTCPGLYIAPAGYKVNAAGDNVELCPSNHHQNGSAAACTECPSPSTYSSAGGLTSVAECECQPGYSRVGGVCTACDIGTYKPGAGDAVCTACGSHATTQSVASVDVLACVCVAEYEPIAEDCIECVEHAYKNIIGNQSCVLCGPNSSLLIDSVHAVESCECKPGYESLSVGACSACPYGKFKADYGNVHCDSCGDFTTTAQIASTNQTQCQCILGFEDGPVGGPDVDCVECQCVASCTAGLYGLAGTCHLCEEGKYRDNVDFTVVDCQLCSGLGNGVRTASRAGSVYATNCSCPEGHMGLSSDKFVVVQSIERAANEHMVSEVLVPGVARIAESTSELVRLDIAGLASDVTVYVNSRVVFDARSLHGNVFSVDLQGMRGDLSVQAVSGTYTLWTHVERDVTLSAAPSWLIPSMMQLLREMALQKQIRVGDYVFDAVFYSDAECAVCAPGLVCNSFI